jgi:hypothetical protein
MRKEVKRIYQTAQKYMTHENKKMRRTSSKPEYPLVDDMLNGARHLSYSTDGMELNIIVGEKYCMVYVSDDESIESLKLTAYEYKLVKEHIRRQRDDAIMRLQQMRDDYKMSKMIALINEQIDKREAEKYCRNLPALKKN